MSNIPAKLATRLMQGLKRFQPILDSARARDVNESDTVIIVMDLLAEIFGYDKYSEITSEFVVRNTFCDLAIKLDGELAFLIEVKAVGIELKDNHIKQAVDYAANQGCEWVALTNAITWKVYRVTFTKPIEHELILEVDLSAINTRKESEFEPLWVISKEGWQKSRLGEYATEQQALSRFLVAAALLDESCLQVLRRELRRVNPDAKLEIEQLAKVLEKDVIKREVLEGEKAESAKRQIARSSNRALRSRDSSNTAD